MKKLLISTLFVMLAACSGEKSNEQNTGLVRHAHISASEPSIEILAAAMSPCSKAMEMKERCAVVLLEKGAAVPKHPLTNTKDVLMVLAYDPATIRGVGYAFRYNCELLPKEKDSDLCLADVAEANRMLEPFLQ